MHATCPVCLTDIMADTEEAHRDLFETLESETHVDMEKLLSLALHGVPDRLRADSWKYMLGVSRPERAEEMSLQKRMEQEHKELEKAWHTRDHDGELARIVKAEVLSHRSALGQACVRLESILCCHLHARSNEQELYPGTVYLLVPFVSIYSDDVEAFYCFQELMKRLDWLLTFDGLKQMKVAFMTLLRQMMPELYTFLEEEQCFNSSWLTSWLQFLLARDLPLPCLLRLWDTCAAHKLRCTHTVIAASPAIDHGALARVRS